MTKVLPITLLYTPEYVRRLEQTDKSRNVRLSKEHLVKIEGLLICVPAYFGKIPWVRRDEEQLREIGMKSGELAQLIEQHLPHLPDDRSSLLKFHLPGCEEPIQVVEILRTISKAIADRPPRSWERPRRRTGAGRNPDRSVELLVDQLARIYRTAGGDVTAGEKGAFAHFLRELSPFLPLEIRRHRKGGDLCGWFMRCAKKVHPELRGSIESGKELAEAS